MLKCISAGMYLDVTNRYLLMNDHYIMVDFHVCILFIFPQVWSLAGRCVLVCARACVWVEGVLLRPGAPGLLLSRGKVIRTDFVWGQRSNSVVLLTASLKIKCSANRSKRAWKGKLPPKLIRAFIIPSQVAERQVCGQHQGNTWSISEGAVSIKL